MIRGLIEREPDPKRPNTFLYNVTFDFLRHMGVGSTKELPEYEKYKEFTKLFIEGSESTPTAPTTEGLDDNSAISGQEQQEIE